VGVAASVSFQTEGETVVIGLPSTMHRSVSLGGIYCGDVGVAASVSFQTEGETVVIGLPSTMHRSVSLGALYCGAYLGESDGDAGTYMGEPGGV
jgi:RNase H-fold protein (predicted Holliday junction resolvase)